MKKIITAIKEEFNAPYWRRPLILDTYILSQFFAPVFLFDFAFTFLIIMVNAIDALDRFQRYPLWLNGLYYATHAPYFISQLLPFAILFGVIFAIAQLFRTNEMAPIMTSGVSLYRIIVPLLLCGIVFSGGLFFFQDYVVVPAMETMDNIEDLHILIRRGTFDKTITYKQWREHLKTKETEFHRYRHIPGRGNRYYYIEHGVAIGEDTMCLNDVMIDRLSVDESYLIEKIEAQEMNWDAQQGKWKIIQGIITEYNDEKEIVSETTVTNYYLDLAETPDYFLMGKKDFEQLTTKQAKHALQVLREQGKPIDDELVEYYKKFAIPFSCLIMVLLGAPLSVYARKAVLVLSTLLCIGIIAVYYAVYAMMSALGSNGVISPFLGAWFSNILFIGAGGVLLFYARK